MPKTIFWIVRHAEREDNINSNWRHNSTLKSDNSPLSRRGQGFSFLFSSFAASRKESFPKREKVFLVGFRRKSTRNGG